MGFLIFIYLIISSLIVLLTIYYLQLKREEKRQMQIKPQPVDMEIAKEPAEEPIVEFQKLKHKKKSTKNTDNKNFVPLPEGYNSNYIHLMVRDPNNLFCYWEIIEDIPSLILRLYNKSEEGYQDIKINNKSGSWYIKNLKADCNYYLEIGKIENGIFTALACSDVIKTPPDRPSIIIDQKWLSISGLESISYLYEINPSLFFRESLDRRRRGEIKASHTITDNKKSP